MIIRESVIPIKLIGLFNTFEIFCFQCLTIKDGKEHKVKVLFKNVTLAIYSKF